MTRKALTVSLPIPHPARRTRLHAVPDVRPEENTQAAFARRDLFFRCYALLAAVSCTFGAVILVGGPDRFTEPSFAGPRELVSWAPFEPWVYWGALFMIHGIVMILSIKRKPAVNVLRFAMVVYVFLTITFLVSVFREPTATAGWCVIFAGFACLALFLSDHLGEYGWGD